MAHLRLKKVKEGFFCGHCITRFEDKENGVIAERVTREFNTIKSWIKFEDESKGKAVFDTAKEFAEFYGFEDIVVDHKLSF